MQPAAQEAARRRAALAFAALFAGATAIGFSAIFVRHADVGPSAVGFWRMALALPLILLWSWRDAAGRESAPPARPWGWAAAAGLAFAVDVFLFHVAVGLTTVAKASLLGNAAPLILAAVGIAFLGDRPGRAVIAALAMSCVGIILLVRPDDLAGGSLRGDMAGLGAAVSYAAYLVCIQRARASSSSAWISLTSTAICGAACLAGAWAMGESILPQSAAGWLAVIALGVVSHALGQGLITVGLGGVAPSLAAVVLIYPAILSTALAAALFGEIPTALQLLGGGMILAALLLARRG